MSNEKRLSDVQSIFGSIISTLFFAAIVAWALYQQSDFFIAIWRVLRLLELFLWKNLFFMFDSQFFEHGFIQLNRTPSANMNANWVLSFEREYNHYLRFLYGSILIGIGLKMYFNYRKVTKTFTIDSMLNSYRHESASLESLVNDNPLDHSRIFDFDNRDDFTNRHAQGLSPQMILEACPPPLATNKELSLYKKAIARNSKPISRPIAIFNREKNTYDFSVSDARVYFERQLTKIPNGNECYSNPENAPRLFNSDGELIDLIIDKKSKIVTGGFSKGGLINNGREFNGAVSDIRLLFEGDERDIFDFILSRYNNPKYSQDELLPLLLKQHAFTRTFLVGLLVIVRENELIGNAEFYMTARRDRGLYFALYSASEENPYYEALGVMAHYFMEVSVGAKVIQPFVKTAIECIEKEAKRLASYKPKQDRASDNLFNNKASVDNIKIFDDIDPDYHSLLDDEPDEEEVE